MALRGLLYSWGRNQNGQLGLGHTDDVLVPNKVAAFEVCHSSSFMLSFSLNRDFTYMTKYLRNILVDANYGVCAQGIAVKMLAAGAEHTAAVTESGKLFGWGWGRYGNLGLGDRKDRLVPGEVAAVPVCYLSYIFYTCLFTSTLCTLLYSDYP